MFGLVGVVGVYLLVQFGFWSGFISLGVLYIFRCLLFVCLFLWASVVEVCRLLFTWFGLCCGPGYL